MDRILKEAKAFGFEDVVIAAIKDCQLEESDVVDMTRSDINSEFAQFNFTVRKKLWQFFEQFEIEKTQNSCISTDDNIVTSYSTTGLQSCLKQPSTSTPTPVEEKEEDYNHEVFQSSSSSLGTEPINELDYYIQRSKDATLHKKTLDSCSSTDDDILTSYSASELESCVEQPGTSTQAPVEEKGDYDDDVFQSSSSSLETEPINELDFYIQRSKEAAGKSYARRSKTFTKFKTPPLTTAATNVGPYPGSIPFPFPFERKYMDCLKVPRAVFSSYENYPIFLKIVQKIYDITVVYLEHKPTKHERELIAKKLCSEYPVLNCMDGHKTLENALRKRSNNVNARVDLIFDRNKTMKVAKKHKRASQSTLEEAEISSSKKARLQKIHSMDGSLITQRIIEEYPLYKDPKNCFEDLAFLMDVSVTNLLGRAEGNWRRFIKNAMKNIQSQSQIATSLEKTQTVLEHIWGKSVASKLLRISSVQVTNDTSDQPYIFCCEDLTKDSVTVTVVSDKIPLVSLKVDNKNDESFKCMLLLLSVYFILNLCYPKKLTNIFESVNYVLKGQKGDPRPGGKFGPFANFQIDLF